MPWDCGELEHFGAPKNIIQNSLGYTAEEMLGSRFRRLIPPDIDPNLPPVAGDAREFQQVVFNLINNAMAAMDGDGGTLTLKAWAEDSGVLVQVKDTRRGIPDRLEGRIFDPFFTTKDVGQGTGMGLSLCYGIVQKYGGRIDFTSVSGEDETDEPSATAFTVSMPLYES